MISGGRGLFLLGIFIRKFKATPRSYIGVSIRSSLQKLMIEIYECTNYISPAILTEFFTTKQISYDLRIKNFLQISMVKTSSYGQSSLSFRDSILWNTLSDKIKSAQNKRVQNNDQKLKGRKLFVYYL